MATPASPAPESVDGLLRELSSITRRSELQNAEFFLREQESKAKIVSLEARLAVAEQMNSDLIRRCRMLETELRKSRASLVAEEGGSFVDGRIMVDEGDVEGGGEKTKINSSDGRPAGEDHPPASGASLPSENEKILSDGGDPETAKKRTAKKAQLTQALARLGLDGVGGADSENGTGDLTLPDEDGKLRLLQIAARIPQHRARSAKEILKTYLRNR